MAKKHSFGKYHQRYFYSLPLFPKQAYVTDTFISSKLHHYKIIKSYQENINKLIVVTGKGIHSQNEKDPYVSKDLSILKYSVPEFISNNKNLMKIIYEMKDAKIEDGGSGAFYIFLKKNKSIK